MSVAVDMELYEKVFFVTQRDIPDPVFEIGLAELAAPAGAAAFVDAYAPEIKAVSRDVAATYFASWAGRLCAAYQYALWHDRTVPGLTLSDLQLRMHRQERGTALSFRVLEPRFEELPGDAEEEAAVYTALTHFYGAEIRPLLEAVAEAGGVPAGSLWGLHATGMYYIFDAWEQQTQGDAEARARLKLVQETVVHKLPPDVFGRPGNPFGIKFRMVESREDPNKQVRVKGSCCLAYKTETGHGYCYTCPKINEEERGKMRLQAREAAAQA